MDEIDLKVYTTDEVSLKYNQLKELQPKFERR